MEGDENVCADDYASEIEDEEKWCLGLSHI
jgi:hypothetical protein